MTKVEIAGVTEILYFPKRYLNYFSQYSILSNNSNVCIDAFFTRLNENAVHFTKEPKLIVDREILRNAKEDYKTFQQGIDLILRNFSVNQQSEAIYIGDQEYELQYAKKLGLQALSVAVIHRLVSDLNFEIP